MSQNKKQKEFFLLSLFLLVCIFSSTQQVQGSVAMDIDATLLQDGFKGVETVGNTWNQIEGSFFPGIGYTNERKQYFLNESDTPNVRLNTNTYLYNRFVGPNPDLNSSVIHFDQIVDLVKLRSLAVSNDIPDDSFIMYKIYQQVDIRYAMAYDRNYQLNLMIFKNESISYNLYRSGTIISSGTISTGMKSLCLTSTFVARRDTAYHTNEWKSRVYLHCAPFYQSNQDPVLLYSEGWTSLIFSGVTTNMYVQYASEEMSILDKEMKYDTSSPWYLQSCIHSFRILRNTSLWNGKRVFYNAFPINMYTFMMMVPLNFNEDITIEEELPYWYFVGFTLSESEITEIDIGNWTVDFQNLEIQTEDRYYYYIDNLIEVDDILSELPSGSEDSIIGNMGASLLCFLINSAYIVFQFFLFLLVLGFNYILWLPICLILLIVNNIVLLYVEIALLTIIWYLWVAISIAFIWLIESINWLWVNVIQPFIEWLWDNVLWPALQWLWNLIVFVWAWIRDNLLIPLWNWLVALWQSWFPRGFWNWMLEVAVPWLLNVIIRGISLIITCALFIVTFGQIDFNETWDLLSDLNFMFFDIIADLFNAFTQNLLELIIYLFIYILLIGMLFVKYFYVKAKGLVKRKEQLEFAIQVYTYPIKLFNVLVKKIKEMIPKGE